MELAERARGIRLAIFDVDGVLTDGTLFVGPEGEAFKAFNVLDGHGLRMLARADVATAILSARESKAVSHRARELGLAHVLQGAGDKVAAFEKLLAAAGVDDEQACSYMGDDLPDLEVMSRCGLAVAPANAVDEIKAIAHYVTRASGGRGAVREFCDLVLRSRAAAR